MHYLIKFLFFFFLAANAVSEETLFKSLASSYLNNHELNSQREKTKAVDETLKYIMLKYSKEDKVWNPLTNRLVSISNPIGQNALKLLDCKLTYTNI